MLIEHKTFDFHFAWFVEKNVIPVTIITIITTHRQFSAAHSDPSSVDCVCFTFTFTLSLSLSYFHFQVLHNSQLYIRRVLIVVGFKELQFMAGRACANYLAMQLDTSRLQG